MTLFSISDAYKPMGLLQFALISLSTSRSNWHKNSVLLWLIGDKKDFNSSLLDSNWIPIAPWQEAGKISSTENL